MLRALECGRPKPGFKHGSGCWDFGEEVRIPFIVRFVNARQKKKKKNRKTWSNVSVCLPITYSTGETDGTHAYAETRRHQKDRQTRNQDNTTKILRQKTTKKATYEMARALHYVKEGKTK